MKRLFIVYTMPLIVSFAAIGQSQSEKQPHTVTTSDGVSIVYDVRGQGSTALVFVHGWSCDRSYWKEQIQPFSDQYKLVTLDLGGHGESGFGRKDWTITSFGNDVATVIKKLKLNKVILIGHSMGGDVITDAALLLPDRVVGLIMVDTYKKLGDGRSIEHIRAIVNDLSTDFSVNVQNIVRGLYLPDSDPALIEYVAEDMSLAPRDVALSALKSSLMHSRQITHDLELLNLPVLAINPDNEPTDFESMQFYGVETLIMPGVGHFPMMEDPERFNKLLATAIQKLKSD